MGLLRTSLSWFSLLIVCLVVLGCSDEEEDETHQNSEVPHHSDRCPGGECVPCEDDQGCDEGSYCGEDEGHQVCVSQHCEPGEAHCDEGRVVRCDDRGTAYLAPQECADGTCTDGECGCAGPEDCAAGEACEDGVCLCSSGIYCGDEGICCEVGDSCEGGECTPPCPGTICGFESELCCEGDTPACGPTGQCAPDCSEQGQLCGEDFDQCCPAGDLCIFGECRTPGRECTTFSECDFGSYCDHGLGRCMPDDFPEDLICEMEIEFEEFESEFLWHWDGVEVGGSLFVNIATTPMVADMTGNGIPEVVVAAYPEEDDTQHMPVVISGATGETLYYNDTRWTRRWGQIALADLTGNGLPEIITGNSDGVGVIKSLADCQQVTAEDDCYLWWTTEAAMTGEAQVVADINADGNAEIVVNDTVLNGLTGEVIATTGDRGYDYTVVADVTGDGTMEILSTRRLLSLEDDELVPLWENAALPSQGMRFAAVGDVAAEGLDGEDRQGLPEFVLTGDGEVYIVAAESGDLLHQFELPGGGNGGPPIIADFDGDGRAEVGIAGSGCYTVFDLDCLGPVDEDLEGCVRPVIEPCTQGVDCDTVEMCPSLSDTGGTGDGILWSVYIQDISSSRTGSSVFDFQGNGRNEVVYNDECLLMVLDGQTGSPLFRHPNTTRTASEYPIVVDVNGDSRTNFVVAANNDRFNRDCRDPIQERPDRYPECHGEGPFPEWCTEGTTGLFALQDPADRWVRTRRIWNQFAYHIENITDDAQVPTSPAMPWETHNTFRANRQGEVPRNAADVAVISVQVNSLLCPPHIDFQIALENQGVAAIAPGLPVTIYKIETGSPVVTLELEEAIAPGGIATVTYRQEIPEQLYNTPLNYQVVANDDGTGDEFVFDCNPDKATVLLETMECRIEN